MANDSDFKRAMRSLASDEILIPTLYAALRSPDFKGFQVPVDPWEDRPYDGKFHPSTHSTWTVRQLYVYLVAHLMLVPDPFELTGVLAVTAGSFWHRFLQQILLESAMVVRQRPDGEPIHPAEVVINDPEHNRAGHADGQLVNGEGLEIKCMAPETRMEMADGTRLPAMEVRVGDEVIGWDESLNRSRPMKVIDLWDNGVQPVFEVQTYEGKTISVTGNHPFLTKRGWVRAADLIFGDKVRVADIPAWTDAMKCLDPEEAHALGVLVGDGGLTGKVMYVTSADPEIIDRLKTYASNHGAELVHADRYTYRFRVSRQVGGSTGNPILTRLREEGLAGRSSHAKRVPPSIWRGGPEAWVQFLSGYFDADGTVVTTRTGSYPHLSWSSVNKDLLLDCQILLIRLGIRSSVVSQIGTYKGQPHQSWNLKVRDRVAVGRARDLLDLWCDRKRESLAQLDTSKTLSQTYRTAEVGWDRIRSIAPAGEQATIGLQIDGGTHLTEGIVTHNTINGFQVEKVVSEAVLKDKKLAYYCQTQDYLDVLELEVMRYLMLNPDYPFKMKEFVVRRNPHYIAQRRFEYKQAVELAERYPDVRELENPLTEIPACCAPKSQQAKTCPARNVCPIGRMK